MPIHDSKSFEAGGWLKEFAFGARRMADDTRVENFLHALSRAILKNPDARTYPDLMTFGYFCRRASIAQARDTLSDLPRRTGWGTLIHIAPSNIPVNFAFSLVMGMVSGNSNIVRVPTQTFVQMELLVRLFDEVASNPEHADFARETAFVQSDHDSHTLKSLVAQADGLIVWGGDKTVERFRALPKAPRCVCVYFPNRVSSAIFSAKSVLDLEEGELFDLCVKFFNDTYLVDQNACSSPNLVFWKGTPADCEAARHKFWGKLGQYLASKYKVDPMSRIERCLDVMALTTAAQTDVDLKRDYDDIWLLRNNNLRDQKMRYGMFLEVDIDKLEEISSFLRRNEQTLSVFGVDPLPVFNALKSGTMNIDRIVPIGRALDIGFNWDGREMLSVFSRKVQVG